MRSPFKTGSAIPLGFTIALSLALAACNGETPAEDDLPDPEISESPDAISGNEIEEAVPGIEAADPEGETSNTADLGDEENAEYTNPGELEYEPQD